MGEHRPYKPGGTGSNPVPPTNRIKGLAILVKSFFFFQWLRVRIGWGWVLLEIIIFGEGSVAQAQLARAVARGLTVSRLIDCLDPDPALGAFWEEPFSKDKPPAQ